MDDVDNWGREGTRATNTPDGYQAVRFGRVRGTECVTELFRSDAKTFASVLAVMELKLCKAKSTTTSNSELSINCETQNPPSLTSTSKYRKSSKMVVYYSIAGRQIGSHYVRSPFASRASGAHGGLVGARDGPLRNIIKGAATDVELC